MTLTDALGPLIAFAASGGWRWTTPEGALFAFVTGDPDDICIRESDQFVLRKSERGSVSGPLIATPDLEMLDRFLSLRYGPDVRAAKGLPPLELPVDVRIVADRSTDVSVSVSESGFTVAWDEGGRTLSASSLSRVAAARLLTYGRRPAGEIRADFETSQV